MLYRIVTNFLSPTFQDYVVTFNVEELRRVVGSVNTMVGNNEVRSLHFSLESGSQRGPYL